MSASIWRDLENNRVFVRGDGRTIEVDPPVVEAYRDEEGNLLDICEAKLRELKSDLDWADVRLQTTRKNFDSFRENAQDLLCRLYEFACEEYADRDVLCREMFADELSRCGVHV